jgi:CRISPR/Cas system-associated protein Csm6
MYNEKKNSLALVSKRATTTERPPLVGEVIANFLRTEGVAWSVQQITTAVNLGFLDRSSYFSIQVAPQLSS